MRYASFFILFAGCLGSAAAADISISGTWLHTAGKADLSAGAGSDLAPQIQSAGGVATVFVMAASGSRWRVEALRANDANWPAGLAIAVRSSNAEGDVQGGTEYLELTSDPQPLFEGTGDASIEIQFRVAGASVSMPVHAYNLLITYRVVSLPP